MFDYRQLNNGYAFNGDCLEVMDYLIENNIKVDAIITDPPYQKIQAKWDKIIPFEPMWKRLNKLITDNGAILLFSIEPFTSKVICSNIDMFKYRLDWNKKIPSGMCNAKIRPMQQTEDICVFFKHKMQYNPQMIKRDKPIKSGGMKYSCSGGTSGLKKINKEYDLKYPTTLIEFDKVRKGSLHPTQKPVALMEYLVKTYTNENELVLDFTAGSFTTGVACQNTNRKFIGIEFNPEKDKCGNLIEPDKYFNIGVKRMEENIKD